MDGTIMQGSIGKYVCYTCKRKFLTQSQLANHEKRSINHKKNIEKREEKMRKRKKELVMAARTLRHSIAEADEILQQEAQPNDTLQTQRMVLEMQLQQILGEYGQAQEALELGRELREVGADRLPTTRETRVGKLELSAGVACWQSNKDVQEDRFILDIELESPEGLVVAGFAVLDGHSGSLCVDHVVQELPNALQAALKSKPKLTDETLSMAVTEACAETDEAFLKKARDMEVLDGSTMILALIYPQTEPPKDKATRTPGCCKMMVACVGDSRAVLCRSGQDGLVAAPMSEDHKPNRPDEQLRIQSKGGIVGFEGAWRCFMPGPANFGGQCIARWGLAVSRAFGDLLLKEAERYDVAGVTPGGLISSVPEIRVVELEPAADRFLVMGSDGVWDVFSSEDAISICAAQATPEIAAQMLLRRTYAASSQDNITALVLTWREIEHKDS